jgi:hypothetical protein
MISLTGCMQAGTDGAILTKVQGDAGRPGASAPAAGVNGSDWYRLSAATGNDLSKYVGNRVTLVGQMLDETAEGTKVKPLPGATDTVPGVGKPSSSTDESHGGPAGTPSAEGQANLSARTPVFRVSSVRKVADTCE